MIATAPPANTPLSPHDTIASVAVSLFALACRETAGLPWAQTMERLDRTARTVAWLKAG